MEKGLLVLAQNQNHPNTALSTLSGYNSYSVSPRVYPLDIFSGFLLAPHSDCQGVAQPSTQAKRRRLLSALLFWLQICGNS